MRNFPVKLLVMSLLGIGLAVVSSDSLTYYSGPGAALTGAPSESNCTSCHSGTAITSGTNYNDLKLTTNMVKNQYVPDSTYKITVSYSESGKSRFGFQTTVLDAANDDPVGTLTVTNSTTTSKQTATVSGSTRQYIQHKSGGTSGSGSISWTFDWKAPSKNAGDVKFYVALNSTNSDNGQKGDKIILKNFNIEPRVPKPTIKLPSKEICLGDTITFEGSATNNPTSYKWTFPNGKASTTTGTKGTVYFTKSGLFNIKLEASNSLGTGEEVVTLRVLSAPITGVDVLGSEDLCEGSTVTLKPRSGASHIWSDGSTADTLLVTKAGKYWVDVFTAKGCKGRSDTIEIREVKRASISASFVSSDSICEGENFTIFANAIFPSYTLLGSSGALLSDTIGNFVWKAAAGNHEFRVTATDSFGCATDTSAVLKGNVSVRNSAPVVSCDRSTSDSLFVSWNDNGSNSYEISLDSGKTWNSVSASTSYSLGGLNYSETKSFHVRGLDKSPCIYSDTGMVACKTSSCFKLNYDLAINNKVCAGDTVEVRIRNLQPSNLKIAFSSKTYDTVSTFRMVPPEGVSSLSISFIDPASTSCPSDDTTISLLANPLPSPKDLTAWTNPTDSGGRMCKADDAIMLSTMTSEGGKPYQQIVWSGNGVKKSGSDYEFAPAQANIGANALILSVIDGNGCPGGFTTYAQVDPVPEVSIAYTNPDTSAFKFTSTVKNVNGQIWDFGDGTTDTSANPVHSYDWSVKGEYTVTLSSVNGENVCPVAKDSKTIAVVPGSIPGLENQITIYPNPVNERVNLKFDADLMNKRVHVRLSDLMGKIVYESVEVVQGSSQMQIETAGLEPGTYFMQIRSEQRAVTIQLIKE